MMKTAFGLVVLALGAGCGSDDGDDGISIGGRPGIGGLGSGGSGGFSLGGNLSSGGTSVGGGSVGGGTFTLPPDFTKADSGGWKLGEPATAAPPMMGSGECNNRLTGIVRDFEAQPDGHPDFEMNLPGGGFGLQSGIVREELGEDRKPVYRPSGRTQQTSGAEAFDQWYRSVDGVNQAYYLTLFFVPSASGTFTFESNSFFPLDGAGFGNSGRECADEDDEDGPMRNFHFTFELHTEFRYNGGETFTFIGDDDVFVFINGRLALDLGGVHGEVTRTIDLDDSADDLGIAPGSSYPLDLFHAERHLCASNFRVDTTLAFTNCGDFVPDVPR